MVDINEMNYEEIEGSMKNFYRLDDLYVVKCYNGIHICRQRIEGAYTFFGDQTPVDYYDIFTDEFIKRYTIRDYVPSLIKVFSEHNIPYKEYIPSDELIKVWEKYKEQYEEQLKVRTK